MGEKVTYFYILSDPMTDEVKYVGRTSDPRVRFMQHLNDSKSVDKYQWIRDLKLFDLLPNFTIIHESDSNLSMQLNWIEKQICNKYIGYGNKLFNNQYFVNFGSGDIYNEVLFGRI